jgi:hypothetical protein
MIFFRDKGRREEKKRYQKMGLLVGDTIMRLSREAMEEHHQS